MVRVSARLKNAIAKTENKVTRRVSGKFSRRGSETSAPQPEDSAIPTTDNIKSANGDKVTEPESAKDEIPAEPVAEKLPNVAEEKIAETVKADPVPEVPVVSGETETRQEKFKLLTSDEASPWQRNWYILSGYRPELFSYKRCIYSIVGYVHNESVNIWTHLFGVTVVIGIILFLMGLFIPDVLYSIKEAKIWESSIFQHLSFTKKQQAITRHWVKDWQDSLHVLSWKVSNTFNTKDVINPSAPQWMHYVPWLSRLWVLSKSHVLSVSDKFAIISVLAGAFICLSASTLFHTFCAHSYKVSTFYNRADFGTIVLMIYGTTLGILQNGFYCFPKEKYAYWIMTTVCSLICAYIILHPNSTQPTYRRIRSFSFIGLGLSDIIPAAHMIYLQGFDKTWNFYHFDLIAGGGAVYIFGAVMYAERYPEKAWPGKFDIFLNSHHFLHVAVLVAAAMHFEGFLQGFLNVHSLGFCSSAVA